VAERVVVIEDEPLVRDLVIFNLKHVGYEVATAGNFAAGLELLKTRPDMAILDVMFPGGDGFSLTREARDQGLKFPILLLTSRSDGQSKVRGFDCGADDYVTKPFDIPELLARVRALLRRGKGESVPAASKLALGKFWVRFDTGRALTQDGEIGLSDKELKLIAYFHHNEDKVISRGDLLEEVWGVDAVGDQTVDAAMARLRALFETDANAPGVFITVRGRGYLFKRPS
jgi:DNA-binding response OmpR family regulator